jgi:Protein of unknown function (DUF2635)
MKKVFVRPREGLLIRNEQSLKHIPPDGEEVPYTPTVRRHLRTGDLIAWVRPAKNEQSTNEFTSTTEG